MWDSLYGFGGAKAVFPNGVPPHKLPKIQTKAPPHKHHAGAGKSGSSGTPSTSTSSPPSSTTAALGLTPALGVRFERRSRGVT
jgi:hypothetical protein